MKNRLFFDIYLLSKIIGFIMKYVHKFNSFNKFTLEGLSKLNEAEVDAAFQDAFGAVLGGGKLTTKSTGDIKKELQDKLSSVKEGYKASLKEYLKGKYDKDWFSSILDMAVSPGAGILKATGATGGQTAQMKAREEAKDKAKEAKPEGEKGSEKSMVDDNPVGAALLKNIALVGLPKGVELKEGMNTDIEPNSDSLVDTLYETSMETASKLFAAATEGLKDLSVINFEFEKVGDKIKQNQENIDKYREEVKKLEESDKRKDWNKMLEMYCLINVLRAQQCALMAAQEEYEFLTGSFQQTFIGKVGPYLQALVEAAFSVLATVICVNFINQLGKTAFIADIKQAVSEAGPTIIKDFQQGVNEIMNTYVNPVTKNPLFMGAVIATYTIFKGGQIAKELEFEDKEKYMMLALEQFVPVISAVNTSLAMCDASFNKIKETVNSPEWGEIENAWGKILDADEDQREEYMEQQKENRSIELYNLTMSKIVAEDSPLILAVNAMEVKSEVKSALTPDAIFNSPIRGTTGFFSLMDSVGLGGDWMKSIDDIFDSIEEPLTDDFEELFDDNDTYTKYINKENPTHAALGGLIFIAQSNVILENPTKFFEPVKLQDDDRTRIPKVEIPKVEGIKLEIQAPEIQPLPAILEVDDEAGGAESCGVYVSIVDKDKNIYKSKVGMLYFASGKSTMDKDKSASGLDGFSGLLQNYELDFIVMGNADITGPDNQKKKGGFIGNIELSRQRANTFNALIKKAGDEKVKVDGCGKMYARNYTDYSKKDLGTGALAKALKVERKDKEFQNNLANDRRMEIIIFPKDGTFDKLSADESLIEEVCKKQVKKEDEKLIVKFKNKDNWSINEKKAKELGLDFKERGEKKEGAKNENNKRYILPFNSFLG